MPCIDPPSYSYNRSSNAPSDSEVFLCGIIKVLLRIKDSNGDPALEAVLNHVDWDGVGLTKDDLYSWWRRHQMEDCYKP